MLSALAQCNRRAVSSFYSHKLRTLSTTPLSNDAYSEALGIFGKAKRAPKEADAPAATSAAPTPLYPNPDVPVNLDEMHHHIPPAQDPILHFLATFMMRDGKYAVAAKRVSETLQEIHILTRQPPLPIVRQAVLAASPAVKCLRHRSGGKTLLKPVALNERQRTRAGLAYIFKSVNSDGRAGKRIAQRLARELLAVINGTSSALSLKAEAHKQAMVNRFVLFFFALVGVQV